MCTRSIPIASSGAAGDVRRLFSYSQNIQPKNDVGIVAEPLHTEQEFGKGSFETMMTTL